MVRRASKHTQHSCRWFPNVRAILVKTSILEWERNEMKLDKSLEILEIGWKWIDAAIEIDSLQIRLDLVRRVERWKSRLNVPVVHRERDTSLRSGPVDTCGQHIDRTPLKMLSEGQMFFFLSPDTRRERKVNYQSKDYNYSPK